MTAPPPDVPGAASPLTRAVLTGPPREGLVLAALPAALYLSVGAHHEVLPVVASDALMLPTATRLSVPGRDIVWGVEPGDTVIVGRSAIQLPSWQVRLVRDWRPARVGAVTQLAGPGLLSELADLLSPHVRTRGLSDHSSAVCSAARCGEDAAVRQGVARLLGAGPGLTPSGDDALCAVLLVLGEAEEAEAGALLGAAVQELWSRTTSLSASLLDAARQGFAAPEVVTLVGRALRGDVPGTREAIASTLAIGHSSGADLVAGVAGALRVLAGARSLIPAC